MTIDAATIYSVLYGILLVQGVVVVGVIIGILLDVKKTTGAVAELGESLSESGKKVQSILSELESRVRSLVTIGGLIALVKDSVLPLFQGDKKRSHRREEHESFATKLKRKIKIT